MHFNASILPLAQFLLPQDIFQLANPHSAMPARLQQGFHEGEAAIHSLLKVAPGMNPTAAGLPMSFAMRVVESPLVAVGTLDSQGRPWTSVWGGERGFAQQVAEGILGLNSRVDMSHDPVYEALWAEKAREGGVVQPGVGKMVSGLAIDLASRDRVKLMGVMVAGSAEKKEDQGVGVGEVQMAMLVTGSLGNCPKYLNKKTVQRNEAMRPGEVVVDEESGRGMLPREAVELLGKADMFFMSSTAGETMDTNHRGGAPGFVRVVRNDEGGVVLAYPEFSGNRLYQTLGNLKVNPLVGIAVPDFETSNVLYLTGAASILIGSEASSLLAHSNLAIKINVTSSRFVKSGLPFQGTPQEYSPYNPPVRHLLTEREPHVSESRSNTHATLSDREALTPTINRYTFTLTGENLDWQPGQHITLDFEPELGLGYSHMREDDPQSLNDDFVRTFTISNEPASSRSEGVKTVQITARKNGPATSFLAKHNLRVPLEIPVLGFGGESSFRLPTATAANGASAPVYIAGGVGITPLLAQAKAVLAAGVSLTVVWSLNKVDVELAMDAFEQVDGLARATTLHVTGGELDDETVKKLQEKSVLEVKSGRIDAESLKGLTGKGNKFYLCAGPKLLMGLQEWLDGEDIVWEDFGY